MLKNNIDCSETAEWNEGEGFYPVNLNGGSFDGKGYTISDLYINRPTDDNVGIFSQTTSTIISNLNLDDVTVTGQNFTGALVGSATNTAFYDVYATNIHVIGTGMSVV